MAYKFTRKNPPLLKTEHGDILNVPSATRSLMVGQSQFVLENRLEMDPNHPGSLITGSWYAGCETTYFLTRIQHWEITSIPVHYSETQNIDVTTTTGYTKTDKTTFENTLEGSIGLGNDKSFFSASVKNDLHLTEETTEEWHSEEVVNRKTQVQGGYTYVTWALYDSLRLTKSVKRPNHPPNDLTLIPFFTSDATLNTIVSVYEDKASDSELSILEGIVNSGGKCLYHPSRKKGLIMLRQLRDRR